MRLGGDSAEAGGVRVKPSSNARAKAITGTNRRDLGEGTLHCALLRSIDQPEGLPGVSVSRITSIIAIFPERSEPLERQIQVLRIPVRK